MLAIRPVQCTACSAFRGVPGLTFIFRVALEPCWPMTENTGYDPARILCEGQGEPGGTRAMGVCEPGQGGNAAAINNTFMCPGEPPRLSPALAKRGLSAGRLGITLRSRVSCGATLILLDRYREPLPSGWVVRRRPADGRLRAPWANPSGELLPKARSFEWGAGLARLPDG